VDVPTPTVDRDPFRPAGNPFVDAWRARLTKTPPRLLDAYLARPVAREHELGPILDEHGVPREFLYLALVESGMDSKAISPAEAVGLWQFRDATARQYGLVITDHIDERVDERRATQAAGRYLRDLYEQFGSWELAAAAYNAGPGRVRRALNATGAETYWDLIEAGHLPRETRAYVPKFLAVVGLADERDRTSPAVAAD
jgi:membrane-bound lytic murein transglycosylase D